MSRIAITGAAGFLGRATVRAARTAGHEVTALVRDRSQVPGDWIEDAGITVLAHDLARVSETELTRALAGVDAVIHAAASMTGDDAIQDMNTVRPTRALISAMAGREIRLVLVSSFSVYGFSDIPAGSLLNETSDIESRPQYRDAYTRAKLAQEALVLQAARDRGLAVRIMRPGAIYGPGHLLSGQLGIIRGNRVICIGGAARVPALHVDHAAAVLVAAASGPLGGPDLPQSGQVEVINLVDPDPPTQSDWLAAVPGLSVVRIPLGLMTGVARGLALAGRILPPLDRKIPTGLRPETLAARYRALRYDAERVRARLGFAPERKFTEAIASSQMEVSQ